MFTRSRTLLQQQLSEKREQERAARAIPARTLHRGNYGGTTSGPVPKSEAYRDAVLLAMAEGASCLLKVPGVCTGDRSTVVACHSNLGIHGKAKNRKADDCYSVWGCAACHFWLDQDKRPSYEEKVARFMRAHTEMVQIWRTIAVYAAEAKNLSAAKRALERLNATPLPEEML